MKRREWLKLTHEEQDKTDKECSEEKPMKSMQHIQCYNCNKTGHITKECPEKKVKDPNTILSKFKNPSGLVLM